MAKAAQKSPLIWGVVTFILIGGATLIYLLIPSPENIRVANIGAQSFSVSWTSKIKAKGCAIAVKDKTLAPLRTNCVRNPAKAQIVEIGDLNPETEYRIYVVHGTQIKKLTDPFAPSIKTQAIRVQEPSPPIPSYGSIVNKDGSPANEAIVFLYKDLSDRFRFPIVDTTNENGNFALDLANLDDPNEPIAVASYVIEVMAVDGSITSQAIDRDVTTPFPTIRLETQ